MNYDRMGILVIILVFILAFYVAVSLAFDFMVIGDRGESTTAYEIYEVLGGTNPNKYSKIKTYYSLAIGVGAGVLLAILAGILSKCNPCAPCPGGESGTPIVLNLGDLEKSK